MTYLEIQKAITDMLIDVFSKKNKNSTFSDLQDICYEHIIKIHEEGRQLSRTQAINYMESVLETLKK